MDFRTVMANDLFPESKTAPRPGDLSARSCRIIRSCVVSAHVLVFLVPLCATLFFARDIPQITAIRVSLAQIAPASAPAPEPTPTPPQPRPTPPRPQRRTPARTPARTPTRTPQRTPARTPARTTSNTTSTATRPTPARVASSPVATPQENTAYRQTLAAFIQPRFEALAPSRFDLDGANPTCEVEISVDAQGGVTYRVIQASNCAPFDAAVAQFCKQNPRVPKKEKGPFPFVTRVTFGTSH